MGQRAASPTFLRKTIRACFNPSQIDSKILLAQKQKLSLQRTINRSEKKDNDYERPKNNFGRRKELLPIVNKPVMRCII